MNNIKSLRKAMKLTQTELANLLNISQGSLSGYETGRIEPDNDMIVKMADIFHVSTDVILGREKLIQTVEPPLPIIQNTEPTSDMISANPPRTAEARILSAGIDKMPARDRERALRMVRLMFDQYSEYFEEENDDDDPKV